MSQAVTLEPVPVDLHQTRAEPEPEDEGLGAHDHYRFDHTSASALSDSSQTSDTLDASSGPPSQSTVLTHPQEPLPQVQALQASALPPSSPPLHSPRSTRSQSLAASLGSQSPIRRKPLSPTASPLAVRFSARSYQKTPSDLQDPEPQSGFYSLDSPDLYDLSPSEGPAPVAPLPAPLPTPLEEESEEESEGYPEDILQDNWPSPPIGPLKPAGLVVRNIPDAGTAHPQTDDLTQSVPPTTPSDATPASPDQTYSGGSEPLSSNNQNTDSNMSLAGRKTIPLHLNVDHTNSDDNQASAFDRPPDSASSLNKPLPNPPSKSPAGSSKISSFFGWGAPSPANTEFSNKDYSPIPSPVSPKRNPYPNESPVSTRNPPSTNAQAHDGNALGYIEAYFPTPPNSHKQVSPVVEIEEMEDELKAISAELASSIRREIDLEDLVERMQAEIANPTEPGKRTSDYFSDSGYSSSKFGEFDQPKEEIAQIQRRAEQEKAQLRLDLTSKLQEERGRRSALDQQIKELAEKASLADAAQMSSKDADVRVKELEKTCEELRRKLSEEREVKDNFEDLLSALKGELQNASLERDNLRDEITRFQARVEGLEAQQAENEKLAYETTKMQQELQELRDTKAKHETLSRLRSSSVTGQSFKLGRPPSLQSSGLGRSNTVKGGQHESRETLSERLKDVEAQRDALHSALKNLLDRQEFQNRENEKRIKQLEMDRDRLLSASPRKAGFEREVSTLREEVSVLRRRAEEALEQKWQVEKGLIGLKSDLDRAEEEIASLRALLNEKDILIPGSFSRYSSSSATGIPGVHATSASLEKAYKDLQDSYRDALERIKNLEIGGTSASQDERTRLAMERLEQSLASALHERDDSRLEAGSLQEQVASLQESEKEHLETERDLADQLRDSANRVEELTQQVRAQLAINATLRSRLSDTIDRGEAGQRANKERLANMQNRMRILEEQVVAAQTAAEERVNRHEEELGSLREATSASLHRLRDSNSGLRSPRLLPPKSPASPLLSPGSARFPRMVSSHSRKSSRNRPSSTEQDEDDNSQVDSLKARVTELEKALVTADFEMQEVVGRMNTAQIEVMTLQEERETAARETKKLQKLLEAEMIKAFQDRFKTITA
ncbi:hypothetical protein VP1G_09201 [Cytospora mali]|uniref:DUF7603 domain-containing protein n=1 Tax=Cytospora mali TaxID=578113 RepID=A0A194VDI7_CYTMA|nr:hypothetical protein VP1G_09201 [Valsa mali var. pyri (nom. inval.)]